MMLSIQSRQQGRGRVFCRGQVGPPQNKKKLKKPEEETTKDGGLGGGLSEAG